MTTSQREDLWTDIHGTEDELPDEQARHDESGGRRHSKINVAALAAALAIPAGAAAITTIGLLNAQPAYASSGGGTTGSSGGGSTGTSGGGSTGTSGGGSTGSSGGGSTGPSGGGTTGTSGGGTTATSGGGTTATSGGGTTGSSGGGTTASSGGGTTASSGGGTTASSGGGTTASAAGSTASAAGSTASAAGSTSGNGTTTSGNGTTKSGNGTTVGTARGIVAAAGDGTGQQGGPPAPQPGQDGAPPAPAAQQLGGQGGDPPTPEPIGQGGAPPAQQPVGQDGAPPAPAAQQPSGQGGDPPAQQPAGQDGAPPAPAAQQPGGQGGAPPAPNSTRDTMIDGIQSWPLPGAGSPSQAPSNGAAQGSAGGAPSAQQPGGQDGAPSAPAAQQPSGQGQPPAEQGQPPAGQGQPPAGQGQPTVGQGQPPAGQGQPPGTAAPTGPAANPAPSEVTGVGLHLFGFVGPAVEATVGNPVHVGGWAFGGVYGDIGVSNIGSPNAAFDISHGYIGGGGVVAGVDGVPVVGTVDLEGGYLWETGKTDYSLPLGSGTTGQNSNQWSPWSPNYYGGIVIGKHEFGGLYGCDGTSCTLTILYGRAWGPRIPLGPVTLKPQGWVGGGLSVTWPSTWRVPW